GIWGLATTRAIEGERSLDCARDDGSCPGVDQMRTLWLCHLLIHECWIMIQHELVAHSEALLPMHAIPKRSS
ncbi:MAG: hypothetical protein MUQ30_10860, partial [Anaerolineae bacterium]|nr:hypothetical protein [Anaerolineae bacterium]